MTNRKITPIALAFGSLVFSAHALSDETQTVSVASLDVKERLQSMETINVSSAKEAVEEAPESALVKALLEEASEIESDSETQRPN